MSTVMFPTISPVGGLVAQQLLTTMSLDNKPKTKNSQGKQFSQQGFSPTNKKLEKCIDTARYRNSFFHNLCLEMLQEGYHLAFCELFNLIKEQEKNMESEDYFDGIGGLPIKEDEEKLKRMKELLVAGELARRQGRADKVYEAQLALASFFNEKKDYFLSDHFYKTCFTTSRQIRSDGGRKEAEANCNLGISAKRGKNFKRAAQFFEQYYLLTQDADWTTSDGILLHKQACDHLQDIYISMSEQLPKQDQTGVLDLLHKAYAIAKEGGDERNFGTIGYLIGNKYDFYGDQESAVKYHTEYFHLCQTIHDDAGMGKACQALAEANKRQGHFDAAVENLKQFLNVTEQNGDVNSRREACSDLGAVYNCMGKYEQSANYYKRAFELSQEKGAETELLDLKKMNRSSCEYAIALGHGLFTGQAEFISQNNKNALDIMLHWKNDRVQGFSNDQHTFGMFESLESKRAEAERISQRKRFNSTTPAHVVADVAKMTSNNNGDTPAGSITETETITEQPERSEQ